MSGWGVYTTESNNKYEGEFKDNIFSGKGKAMFATGETYVGEF